jgi:hypothetical protein
MLYKTMSAAVYGIDASIIDVEVDVSNVKLRKITSIRLACRTPPSERAATASAPP